MKRKKRQPNAAVGRLTIAMGASYFLIAVFSSLNSQQRFGAAACGCSALAWGLRELAAVKKWQQEPEDDHYATTAAEIRESVQEEKLEKSGSMHNVFVLLGWVFLFMAVAGAIVVGYLFWTKPRP
ncbi:MAG TPA: hypothetical protein VGO57_18585 [Verrucomicrobiae bacterium]|jgi:hypothetical protein